jgi:hypothetical protein
VAFKIFLEGQRFVLVGEGAIPGQFPGFEFRSVGGFTGVVLQQPPLQICRRSDIFLFGKINAADDLDVPHLILQPVVALRAMPGTLRPSGRARLRHA